MVSPKRILLLDDNYGKINSHWPYNTKKIYIEDRIYYDEPDFLFKLFQVLSIKIYDAFCFSGRNAPEAAKLLDSIIINSKIRSENLKAKKVFKIHNTNMYSNCDILWDKRTINEFGNDWAKAALKYPFDVILVQTYGDSEIINRILGNKTAHWVPFCYNDNLFYLRDEVEKDIDIGAFCKTERHAHRIPFIEKVRNIAEKNNFSFEFSDKYWGEEYARNVCRPKIMVHLSYCGDIPWRLYECAASKTCFLTDPLSFGVERLFVKGKDYIEFNRDLSNLEEKIKWLLENESIRKEITEHAYKTVKKYTWEKVSEELIFPLL